MLQILIKILAIISLLGGSNLVAQSHNSIESNNDSCSNLIDRVCTGEEQNIYELWQEMGDQSYKMQENYVKTISQEILTKCKELILSRNLCALVSLEAMFEANNSESQDITADTLTLLLDQDLLFSSIETSIYLSMEYLRLLHVYSWEDQLIDTFSKAILDEAMKSDLASEDPWMMGEIYYGIAKYQEEIKDNLLEAIKFYYLALEFFEISEDMNSIIWTYADISYSQFQEADLESARITALKALSLSTDNQDLNDTKLRLLSLLGTIEIALNSGREEVIGRDLINLYQEAFYSENWNKAYDSSFASDIEKYIHTFDCERISTISKFFNDVIAFRDAHYGDNKHYLDYKIELDSAYFEISFSEWRCLEYRLSESDDNERVKEKFIEKTNQFLQVIENKLDEKEFHTSYFESHVLSFDLYDYLWSFDNAVLWTDYSSKNFYRKITSISENWINQIIAEDLTADPDAGFYLLSIISQAITSTNDLDDANKYIEKLLNFLDEFSKLEVIQNSKKTHAFNRLFYTSTALLYEYSYEELAEEIFRKYFLSNTKVFDESFSEIVKRINLYEETNFIVSADILIDEHIHQIRTNASEAYEFNLLNKNLRSRMRLNRSKYEVLALKDYFEDQNVRELIQAYISSNSTIAKTRAKNAFLNNENIKNYLDLAQKTSNINTRQQQTLINNFFPDVKFQEYQKLLDSDETLIIQTVVSVDYSIYFYSLMITDEDYVISRLNLYDAIEPYMDENDFVNLEDPKQNLVSVWSKYIEAVKGNYFKNSDYRDIGTALSEIHLFEMKEFIDDRSKLIFINDFNSVFSPDLLLYEDNFLVEKFEISQFISLFDFLNRNKQPLNYSNYFGFAAQEFNPIFQVDSLENTANEIQSSSKLFKNKINYINKEFSKDLLKKNQYQNSVLHFATHNVQVENSIFGDVPALLTGNKSNEEYLDIINISNLALDNSFILLAACNTTEIMSNDSDAFSGLVKSFKLAGAEKVFATRWEIETLSSEKFIVSYLAKVAKGIEPNAALALTKREFVISNDLNHPIFWGAFTLIN